LTRHLERAYIPTFGNITGTEAPLAMRVGVLGGTFDPIHYGHLIIAQEAVETLDLATVIFVPSAQPPHKPAYTVSPGEDRYRMVELAIACDPRFTISDIEQRRVGRSYTIDTLREMSGSLAPGDELCFLVGSDTVPELGTWRDVGRFPEFCRLIVVGRPGYPLNLISTLGALFPEPVVDQVRRDALFIDPIGISATAIRRKVAQGRSITYLVPEPVRLYIEEHKLYRPPVSL
jgi:nicotinate-nucleotide adenylyltransferase